MDYCKERIDGNGGEDDDFVLTYEVDTVPFDGGGGVQTDIVPCYGAGTLGTEEGKNDVLNKLIPNMKNLAIIGVGVTEAGLSSVESKAVQDLADILKKCCECMQMQGNGNADGNADADGDGDAKSKTLSCDNPNGKISVVCTDNVPNSGALLKRYMLEIASASASETSTNNDSDSGSNKKRRVEENGSISFEKFLEERVVFHDTMVDRITSQRDGSNGMVPR